VHRGIWVCYSGTYILTSTVPLSSTALSTNIHTHHNHKQSPGAIPTIKNGNAAMLKEILVLCVIAVVSLMTMGYIRLCFSIISVRILGLKQSYIYLFPNSNCLVIYLFFLCFLYTYIILLQNYGVYHSIPIRYTPNPNAYS
jgi:hypothetical protein